MRALRELLNNPIPEPSQPPNRQGFTMRNCSPNSVSHLGSRFRFSPHSGLLFPFQGTPVPCVAKVGIPLRRSFLASSRLARPNRLYNCAVFLAKPL